MIKDNQRHFNRLHVLIDALVVIASWMLAWVIQFKILGGTTGLTFWQYMVVLAFLVPVFITLYMASGLYTTKSVRRKQVELGKIAQANTVGLLIFLAAMYLMRSSSEITDNYSRRMLFYFYVINIATEGLVRNFIRLSLQRLRRKGFNQKHMLLVGYSRAAEEYVDRMKANPEWGYELMGILDDNVECGMRYRGVQVVGRTEEIEELLARTSPDEIAITLGLSEYSKLEHIVAVCEKSGVHTKFVPDYNNIIPTRPYTEDIDGLPVINIRHVPLTNTFNAVIKRTMDIIGGVGAIILFSPIMLITAIAIKVTSPGPLIYTQERVGLHNKNFRMYKFRSMDVQSPKKERGAWTVPDDPRVTSVGKIIRKTSIDELPQLFNILKGDMSLVGPRPERPFFVEKFREEIPRYMIKHQVRPGMTGWAQINGYRGNTSIRKRIEYDLYYIENWTPGFDIKILFLTIFKGFINKNAY
ncbi:MAG: undecaprenyl-phosphate glucose phosphotransferase [Lachnospiraceae bacterium]|nr:undecaprenyl-phosphate glucose phosphotransferase [Lachnospiraceae bacterium]MCI9304862.1 undecaprenyl-phosphate glucose phosphotransferase [Lachnospiraceae bacterium]